MIGPDQHQSTIVPSDEKSRAKLSQTTGTLCDRLQNSLQRLQQTGAFDSVQLRLIGEELKHAWCDEDAFDHIALVKPGDRVDRFKIQELLGVGGEAHVFRAREIGTDKICAVKVLNNARTSERFRREMQMVQQLAHPNIVTAYDVGEIHGMPYIVMELMRGPDLNAYIQSHGPICWKQSARYVLQISRALAHAHLRDLIHRDIKPGNIIMNGNDHVKLVDLGLAAMGIKSAADETQTLHLTRDAQIAGTLPYMAPEQARSLAKADARADIYGLGATWFYLLTGKTRIRGKSFSRQYRNLVTKRRFRALPQDCLPKALLPVYRRMVAYNRQERYQSCSDLTRDLGRALMELGQVVTSRKLNVLIVEDSKPDMFVTVELLRMTNDSLAIHQATTLAEAIEVQRRHPVDLTFLDLTLPDSIGVSTVEQFRQHATDTPVVVLSGCSDNETARECVRAGATEFISKINLTPHKLERLIFVTLSRHAALEYRIDPDEGSLSA